jgi:putative ATP-dependent endonuclease of the OLD family
MQLRRLVVRHFRGIRHLDWTPNARVACLIGPGDSTKTTVLEAVEWALSPRWTLQACDTDFFRAVPEQPVVIEATVGELPMALLSDQKFGLEQRGWCATGLHDEPEEGDEAVLTVRLTIDDSLEPRWEVINDRQLEPRVISARDRESMGATRLGPEIERHLTWGRGSALLRLTDSTEGMSRTLAEAHRTARNLVTGDDLVLLTEAAERASEAARGIGAGSTETFRPALDAAAVGAGPGSLGLHQGPIPVRAAGLGSRRLAALAVQRASFREGAIVLVDEVETGLEPHRLRHLLRKLRADSTGQVLMTTHSPVAIVELTCGELGVVRATDGTTTVQRVPDHLQGPVRAAPEALLGRRIVVCEGKTEVGLCRALDPCWTESHGSPPANVGAVFVPGGGTAASRTALAFAALGYPTALLVDSDVELDPPESQLVAGNVNVFAWAGGVCTEERVMLDLPWEVLLAVLRRAAELLVEDMPEAVTNAVAEQLGAPAGTGPDTWLAAGRDQDQIRHGVGRAAKIQRWFKRTDLGEALGDLVAAAMPQMAGTDVAAKVSALGDWMYAT